MTRKRIVPAVVVLVALGVLAWRLGFARDAEPGQLAASGTVEATEAQLGFQAAGVIDTLMVQEGDAVRRGMELAHLDRAEALARQRQAVAQASAAGAQLRELERGSRREEIAQAAAARDAARERVRDAERDLVRTTRLF